MSIDPELEFTQISIGFRQLFQQIQILPMQAPVLGFQLLKVGYDLLQCLKGDKLLV